LTGPEPDPMVEVWEDLGAAGRISLAVDVRTGHKTGCYLDQRVNRAVVVALAAGRDVLDVCSFTGGFSLASGRGGARSLTAIDSSGPSLAVAQDNLTRNGLAAEIIEADAFAELRAMRHRGREFDLIVCDPPKLAANEREVQRASRAYKDMNLSALRLLRPGGILVTFSCSGAVSEDLFQKILFGAALDAGREARIVQRLGQASDHPVLLSFPESQYLKGFVIEVD